jgi:hypothetical protein
MHLVPVRLRRPGFHRHEHPGQRITEPIPHHAPPQLIADLRHKGNRPGIDAIEKDSHYI